MFWVLAIDLSDNADWIVQEQKFATAAAVRRGSDPSPGAIRMSVFISRSLANNAPGGRTEAKSCQRPTLATWLADVAPGHIRCS